MILIPGTPFHLNAMFSIVICTVTYWFNMSDDTVKKTRVLTADGLVSLLEAAVNKIAKPHAQA